MSLWDKNIKLKTVPTTREHSFTALKDFNVVLNPQMGTLEPEKTVSKNDSIFFSNSKYHVDGEVSRDSKYILEGKSPASDDSITSYQMNYQGERDDDFVPHGYGMMQFGNGDVYLGQYNKGVKEGRGSYSYQDGSLYLGEWKKGQKQGFGMMKYADGSMYEGSWEADQRHGWGKYDFINGDLFEGQFHRDTMNGPKCLYSFAHPSNLYYFGPFAKNKIHWSDCAQVGTGRLYMSKGVAVVNRLLYAERYPDYDVETVIKNFQPDQEVRLTAIDK